MNETCHGLKFFMLIPIADGEEWKCSVIKEKIIVEAENEEEAREIASKYTRIAVAVERGKDILISPWINEKLVTAKVIPKIPEDFPKERIIRKDDPIDKFDL